MTIIEQIHQAAILGSDGSVFTLGRPSRHNDIIKYIVDLGEKKPIRGEQGFTTTKGRFLDRRQAAALALMTGQIEALRFHKNQLFSEDLW